METRGVCPCERASVVRRSQRLIHESCHAPPQLGVPSRFNRGRGQKSESAVRPMTRVATAAMVFATSCTAMMSELGRRAHDRAELRTGFITHFAWDNAMIGSIRGSE